MEYSEVQITLTRNRQHNTIMQTTLLTLGTHFRLLYAPDHCYS